VERHYSCVEASNPAELGALCEAEGFQIAVVVHGSEGFESVILAIVAFAPRLIRLRLLGGYQPILTGSRYAAVGCAFRDPAVPLVLSWDLAYGHRGACAGAGERVRFAVPGSC